MMEVIEMTKIFISLFRNRRVSWMWS